MQYPISPQSQGCASAVEDYAATLISSSGTTMISAAFINLLAMLVSCCMWWKRKPDDVFPDFLREARVGAVEYGKVKEQFEIKPKEHYLDLRGFI